MGDRHAVNGGAGRLFTGWRGAVVALFCLTMVVLCGAQLFANAESNGAFGSERAGSTGLGLQKTPSGWLAVRTVARNGGGDRANIKVGDMIRFDDPLMLTSNPPVGTIAQFTVRHSGQDYRKLITFLPFNVTDDRTDIELNAIASASQFFCLLLGILLMWRGWGDHAALMLGIGLVGYPATAFVPWWALHSPLTPLTLGALLVLYNTGLCVGLFPAWLYNVRVARLGLTGWLVTLALTGMTAAINIIETIVVEWQGGTTYALLGLFNIIYALYVGQACWWSWRGSRTALGTERNRFVILLLAESLILLTVLINLAALYNPGLMTSETRTLAGVLLNSVAFPLTLAYIVLRHRVIDLGFALNRTVVYGSVSALLLGSFGLIEWGIEHWMPESWVRASVWIDAGAALLVYMAFHRAHGAVETRVEHLFFHKWQSNEAILRRFVASAPHFEDERALARSFADELARFAGDARVALYRRRDRTHDAILERMAGSWDTAPRTLPVDDPAFALMRVERSALDLSDALTDLPGVLALPMLDHGILAGLVLMDLKGNGALYRADEVAVLGWAAHNVALAMAALHAGLIESENRLLKAQLARLGSLIGDRMDHAGA